MEIKKVLIVFAAFATFLPGSNGQDATPPKSQQCYNIGDTITVRGRVVAGINDGTYFELKSNICIHYPKATDQLEPVNLTTLGDKLQTDRYLEITGQIRDMQGLGVYGVGILPANVKDVDSQVKAGMEDLKRSCEKWQNENSSELGKRAHGAKVVKDPQDSNDDDYVHGCAISATDKKGDHEKFIVRRPNP
jgi:hypothetical protein